MPQNSTLIPGSEQDEERNIGQRHADQTFSGLSNAERAGTVNMDDFENSFKNDTADIPNSAEARKREHEAAGAPQPSWADNTGQSGGKGEKKGRWKGWFKKASPALGIGGIFGIGGFVLIGLTSPSLLIVQMKEVMTSKFNTQLATMESRSTKLLASKMQGATSGFCSSSVTIRCKFTTMSKTQVERMAAAGITIEGDETVTGRIRPTGMVFKDASIRPADFTRTASSNAEFRSALRQAYNPKYAGFVGKAWAAIATKHKVNKQMPELDTENDPEAAREKLNTIASEGVEPDSGRTTIVASDADCESNCVSQQDADEINSRVQEAEAAKSGGAAAEVRSKLSGLNSGVVGNVFKITGPIDGACQVYGGITMLSYLAKTIRMSQLIRFALVYFTVADAIKGGESPNPKDVELLGTIATTTVKDQTDSTKTLVAAGTDSFGYKYAAYGDASASEASMKVANRFMAGGGFVGEMSGVTATVMSFLPGGREGAKATCGTLANPFVQGASIVLGIASLFVPGANVGRIVASGAASAAVGVAVALLPVMLADIVAGTVTDNIVGEEAVNAIASGSGGLMSDGLAAQNGNGPMTKEDTLAYLNMFNGTNSQYIADEVRETSPFDATNPHTFLGSITATLLPLKSSSNPVASLASVINSSVSSLIPKSKAVTAQQEAASLDVCQDPDILDGGYAADPFCNVIRGIPPQYLDRDPVEVATTLFDQGNITEDGTPTGTYAEFIKKCITNEEPLGYKDADTGFDVAAAQECIVDNENANFYVNYADQRIELGMNGEDVEGVGGAATSTAGATVDESQIYLDSTSVGCAPGTTEVRNDTGYNQGTPYPIKLCSLPNTYETDSSKGGRPGMVNSRASGAAYAMFEAMKKDLGKDRIALNDSFRTNAEQIAAKAQYGGQAASPGYSNHQTGIAFDINMGSANGGNATSYRMNVNSAYPGNPVWEWLKANAGKFNFKQLPSEGWHWSVTGG